MTTNIHTLIMQKEFYYKLLKRLGIFPEATFDDANKTIAFDSGSGVPTPQLMTGGTTSAVPGRFYSLGGQHTNGATTAKAGYASPFSTPGTLSHFCVFGDAVAADPPESFIVTVGGVATSLVAVVTSGNVIAIDSAHSVHVEQLDTASVQYDPASAGAFGMANWCCRFTPDPD